ncbi:ATP synthase subunit b [Candidatus Blochmanniella vafra str. BVAF]|uniref:ATP synthase subunit b n=1 Tax=Blochmanniella vafra (strain BVAF) TaxID=859654 RepID=E8Q5U9_BLOVB|nr:F0F1 ATP synthase subunit B [Candidatus Blochmannia vafer]ADV33418.1 ATP synthase subunit b [Candidatus Blochmannia vafer str. BVAF]
MNLNATILGQSVSFIFFVWFCMRYVWSPLMLIIEKRRRKISDSLENIKQSEIKCKLMHNEAEICLRKARIKSEEIIKHAYKCKSQILHDAQQEAHQEFSKIVCKAKAQIDQERKRVADELRKKIGQFIMEGVEKIVDNRSISNIISDDYIHAVVQTLLNED